jgi:hypothetical protein
VATALFLVGVREEAIEDAKLCNDILVAGALFLEGGRGEGDQRGSHRGCKAL